MRLDGVLACSYGLETSLEWRPYKWWLMRGWHAYMEQDDRHWLTYEAPHHNVGITNRFYIGELTTLNTQLYWTGTNYDWTGNRISKYQRFDIRLAHKFLNRNTEIAVGATNLNDPFHRESRYRQVPRQLYIQVFQTF